MCHDLRAQNDVGTAAQSQYYLFCCILRKCEVRGVDIRELEALGNEGVEIITIIETQHGFTTHSEFKHVKQFKQYETHRQRARKESVDTGGHEADLSQVINHAAFVPRAHH